MRGIAMHVCLALVVAVGASVGARGGERRQDQTGVWQPWEHARTSEASYARPLTDVLVRARFVGPRGEVRSGLGFWDGGKRFLIRCAFPSVGRWQWMTTCTNPYDRGLHGRSGVVIVKPASSTNPFLRRGHLRVSRDGRLLVFADGTPFLWIGDTCWAAPVHATEAEWRRYVADRRRRGYTVLQMAIAPDWALEHSRLGIAPFLSRLPDITTPNPRFFQRLDRLIAHANDQGLAIMMVGLMETPYRYPPPNQIAVFSRYVASRYGSFTVMFSPSFDSGIRETETLASGRAIREAAPWSLVTMHMGTGVGPRFHAEEWLSFDMYQSGHNGGDAGRQSLRATRMPAEILALKPRKPIVNGEAIYEGDLGGAYDVRRTAWLSFLSGAVGYTAGINEVYEWTPDVMSKIGLPSSDQVSLVARVLSTIPWWDLGPAPERITNQPGDPARLMALAVTTDRLTALAYLPDNEAMEADLTGGLESYDLLWINPATGACLPGGRITASRRTRFICPDRRDWILLLTAPGSALPYAVRKVLGGQQAHSQQATATILFAPNAAFGGLVLKMPRDGVLVSRPFGNVACMVNENPARNTYCYLDVDDRIAFRGGVRRMLLEVRLHTEEPTTGIRLQYDAEGPPEISHRYREVLPEEVSQDGPWTNLVFAIDRPWLGDRQNAGADLRLFLDRRLCYIASIRAVLEQ